MRAIDKKALRDLWHMRGQALAVGVVIASGIAVLISSLSTQKALLDSTHAYYERYGFADVFASVERAPQTVVSRIRAIPGVQQVATRVVQLATLDISGFAEPVSGLLVSIPEGSQPALNRLVLRKGRLVSPGRSDEVIVNEPFAHAHGLELGDTLDAVLNGHRRQLRIVGLALAPDFIYAVGPGALMPDDLRFGVLWMGERSLAAAFDLTGAFNDLALRVERGVDARSVITDLDPLLDGYGGTGAIARADQISNWFVMNQIEEQGTLAIILPSIFLVVAMFLTHSVVARLIATERPQIGLMKAFGYSAWEVGWHYAKFALCIAAIGIAIGLLAGVAVGRWNTQMHAEYYRFPTLLYSLDVRAFALAAALSAVVCLLGALTSVRRAARLPPARAMIPPSPPSFTKNRLSDTRLGRWLDQPSRIAARNIIRSPLRSLLTFAGIAASTGLLILSLQWNDALTMLAERFFFDAQRQDVGVTLAKPLEATVVREFEKMRGVYAAEGSRVVAAEFWNAHRRHRGSLIGIEKNTQLQPIFDEAVNSIVIPPPEGVVLARRLADKLGLAIGDLIRVQVLEGKRPLLELPVADVVEVNIGLPAYVRLDYLNRALRERPVVEIVNLRADPRTRGELYEVLKSTPLVASVALRQSALETFQSKVIGQLLISIIIFCAFACSLALGVAYNAARIGLSERGRELATLRVLGFTRAEISYVLLAEVALLVILSLPVGCLVGLGLTRVMAAAFENELYSIPLLIEPSTYGWALLITLLTAALAVAAVRQRLDHLDLIKVLKTRE